MAERGSDERRLRLRRRLLVVGVLPLLLALALGVKVAAMLALDEHGRGAFGDGRFERAADAFGANGLANVFEPWVATFDEGTAEYALEDYERARRLLEEALLVVPADQQCVVRVNLALTLEALGDSSLADGRRDLAEASWREGIAVLDEGACRGVDTDAAEGPETAAAGSVAARLADKLSDRAVDPDDPVNPDDPPTLEELERRNEEAQEQRRRSEETREDEPETPEPSAPPSYSW